MLSVYNQIRTSRFQSFGHVATFLKSPLSFILNAESRLFNTMFIINEEAPIMWGLLLAVLHILVRVRADRFDRLQEIVEDLRNPVKVRNRQFVNFHPFFLEHELFELLPHVVHAVSRQL